VTRPQRPDSRTAPDTAFPALSHNHGACLDTAIERARAAFEIKGMRLTDLRREVFEEIAGSHHSVGAYDVLDRLARKGRRLAPISVYRAIDALIEAGVIHRLESRNAFFACHARHSLDRDQVFLACERCGRVAEVDGAAIFAAMGAATQAAQFTARRTVVEVAGVCLDCAAGGQDGSAAP
jgi:Fur family zinc uptake transcriptional regulator